MSGGNRHANYFLSPLAVRAIGMQIAPDAWARPSATITYTGVFRRQEIFAPSERRVVWLVQTQTIGGMRTAVPEKLLKIADDIAAKGNVPLTRLTVLKKWFERPRRLAACALWVARRAISHGERTDGDSALLFRQAALLLSGLDAFCPTLVQKQQESGRALYVRLQEFQNVYRESRWVRIRTIEDWDLFLIERCLAILLHLDAAPGNGYKLVADYCQNYDPRYGNGLNGPAVGRLSKLYDGCIPCKRWNACRRISPRHNRHERLAAHAGKQVVTRHQAWEWLAAQTPTGD